MSMDHVILIRPHPGHVRLRDTPDGGALFTTMSLQPGDIVMLDNPVALYPSSPDCLRIFCSYCFRALLPSEPLLCPRCNEAFFCSEQCLVHSHPDLICHALPALLYGKAPWSDDILFLLAAYSLRFSKIFRLLPLDLSSVVPDASMERLHSELASLCTCTGKKMPSHFKPEFTYGLLSMKRKICIALKTPRDPKYESCGVDGARGYGLYLWSSMLNHSCIPNVSRFDHVDVPGIRNNTSFQFRAVHAIKDEVEITTRYVDVAWGYRERHDRLIADYGLKCDCRRCKTESQWMEKKEKVAENNNQEGIDIEEMNEEEQEMNQEGEVLDVRGDQELEMSEGGDDNSLFLINEYIRRHICDCGGFLALTPPVQMVPGFVKMECNGCREFSNYEPGDPWDDAI